VLRRLDPRQLLPTRVRRLFLPAWGSPRVEPLLDDLFDLPSGEIELAGDRRPDHRDALILPGGGEFDGAGLIDNGRGAEDAGHLIGGMDVEVRPQRLSSIRTRQASSRSHSSGVLPQGCSDKLPPGPSRPRCSGG
jgi:hypothetical protein